MKFWDVDVEVGEGVDVTVPAGKALFVAEATLDQKYSGNQNVYLYIHYKQNENILFTLNPRRPRDCSLNIVVERNFKLSQSTDNPKPGFVTFRGYFADNPEVEDYDSPDDNKKRIKNDNKKRVAPSGSGSKKWKRENKKFKKVKK